ncbi:CRIB domain-containing protein [Stylosanthes scabra]|uniref:CRIB domain-containing protein n=1 Tax=Stylosanthes scabra TaxID=79078 RepID=A0ABU6ZQW1_9FABA|nr:CRIB domain-containing protein [Stylosanthes scabra]
MRQRMERLVILPFSAGCISEASVAVGLPQPTRRSKSLPNTSIDPIKGSNKGSEDSEDASTGENLKNPMRLLENVPKPNISTGFNRLVKGFKNISQLFVEKDDDDEDDEDFEELDMDMEIGCPTDVQHVTHIGLDGITTTPPPINKPPPPSSSSSSSSSVDSIKGWDHLIPHELLTLSAHQSLQQQFHEVSNLNPKLEPPSCSPMKPSPSN